MKPIGIQVNLFRAIDRIRLRTEKYKASCFGLFVDFANAFNSVPHKLLCDCLRRKEVMPEDHIQYLENLYARYHIRIGNRILKVNKGVAQGSIISPALFNIFIEDLAIEISNVTGLSKEDILLYADDLLALCSSVQELKKVTQVIDNWAKSNGMEHKKKVRNRPIRPSAS